MPKPIHHLIKQIEEENRINAKQDSIMCLYWNMLPSLDIVRLSSMGISGQWVTSLPFTFFLFFSFFFFFLFFFFYNSSPLVWKVLQSAKVSECLKHTCNHRTVSHIISCPTPQILNVIYSFHSSHTEILHTLPSCLVFLPFLKTLSVSRSLSYCRSCNFPFYFL